MSDATPTATEKLRTVLDYVPCEACLATPSDHQELLCSLCRRLDREVAVKFVTRTSVILDRPAPAPAREPVVIPPAPAEAERPPTPAAPPAEPQGPLPVEVLIRRRGLAFERRPGAAIEVVVEPYDDPATANGAADAAAAAAAAEAAAAEAAAPDADAAPAESAAPADAQPPEQAPAEAQKPKRSLFRRKPKPDAAPATPADAPDDDASWDDVASFTAPERADEPDADAFDDLVTYQAPEPERAPEPEPAAAVSAAAETEPAPPEDDFVFRPPAQDDVATRAEPAPPTEEDWLPTEEIPLEAPHEGRNPWARPDTEPTEAEPAETEPIEELEIIQDTDLLEDIDDIHDTDLIEETEVVEETPTTHAPEPTPATAEEDDLIYDMEILPHDEPQTVDGELLEEPPTANDTKDDSDLWRLEGFHQTARTTLSQQGIQSLAHLSGHDANELATRTGLDETQLQPWIHTADLTHEAGIPIQSAQTLVRAGIRGPRTLAETDTNELHNRLQQLGSDITTRELQRWKRRV